MSRRERESEEAPAPSALHLLDEYVAACGIAAAAHAGQTYADLPYFDHHLRGVERRVTHLGYPARTVALLHDVIEDTDETALSLMDSGINPRQVSRVLTLTRRPDDVYLHTYLPRVCASGDLVVLEVKRADLEFNIANADGEYVDMRQRWTKALVQVLEAIAVLTGER